MMDSFKSYYYIGYNRSHQVLSKKVINAFKCNSIFLIDWFLKIQKFFMSMMKTNRGMDEEMDGKVGLPASLTDPPDLPTPTLSGREEADP